MLRKKVLWLGLLLFVVFSQVLPAAAWRPIEFGIKAGVQTQSIKMLRDHSLGEFTANNDFGFQVGFTSRISFATFFLQPELVYSHHKFTLRSEDANASVKTSMNNFELPIMAGAKLLFFRFYAGPVFVLTNGSGNTLKSGSQWAFNSELYRPTVNYQLGVGVEFGHFNVDIRYGGQFKKATQYIYIGESDMSKVKTRLNQWQLNVAYFF